MVAKTYSFAFVGIEAKLIEIQTQIAIGMPAFNIVGLPNKAINESKERIRASFSSISLALPMRRITVNLSPADIIKEGSHFDLAIAVGLFIEMGVLSQEIVEKYAIIGEICLDGRLSKVAGVLPASIASNALGKGIICSRDNYQEAFFSGNEDIIPISTLNELLEFLKGDITINKPSIKPPEVDQKDELDMADVKGQILAKRAAEIAAAGMHNLLMVGAPGTGKSMIARRIISILPDMTAEEKLESSIIYSISGYSENTGIIEKRPYRSPHCSSSCAAIVGGGRMAKPGEVTIAHNGVLFLDELPEFHKNTLESLRQPMEEKKITIARVNHHITYPAKFQLIAAMNPCKCGYFEQKNMRCSKAPRCAEEYQAKISGPMLDRFDLQVEMTDVNLFDYTYENSTSENSETIRARVVNAWNIQKKRFENSNIRSNSDLEGVNLDKYVELDQKSIHLLKRSIEKFHISARGASKLMKVSRTIADLENSEKIYEYHVAEALTFRLKK